MTLPNRLKATRIIAVLAMVLMLGSYGTYKLLGIKELYPFFYWRLFSTPVGWDGAQTYRLYSRTEPDATWERHAIRPAAGYSIKDYQYQWVHLVNRAIEDPANETGARDRLAVFAELTAPDGGTYRVVEETYMPLELLRDSSRYDTTTVLRFTRPTPVTRLAE